MPTRAPSLTHPHLGHMPTVHIPDEEISHSGLGLGIQAAAIYSRKTTPRSSSLSLLLSSVLG